MNKRILWVVCIIAIVVVSFLYFVFETRPPQAPNELIIKKGAERNWSLSNEETLYGQTIWSQYAEYPNDTIRLWYCLYWGALEFDKRKMSWEDQNGDFVSKPLTLNDLIERWQDTSSVFRFRYEKSHCKVSFTIPKLENGTFKYTNVKDAWNNGELYQIVEEW